MDRPRTNKVSAILGLSILFIILNPFVTAAQSNIDNSPKAHQELERFVTLSSDHALYDSSEFSGDEQAGTAVSPYCKSFTFLCHVRCLQRGDNKDPGNTNSQLISSSPPSSSYSTSSSNQITINEEIIRCSHVPNTNTNRVLCLCNNGVDLTAEVDYALEGVVDIQAAGGNGSNAGEAGTIRKVVYAATKTVTVTVTIKETVTLNPVRATQLPKSMPTQYLSKVDKSKGFRTMEVVDDEDDVRGQNENTIIRKGSHHDFVKVKGPQKVSSKAGSTEIQAHFGIISQKLGQAGNSTNNPVDNGELQAYKDLEEVEAEDDVFVNTGRGQNKGKVNKDVKYNDDDDDNDNDVEDDDYKEGSDKGIYGNENHSDGNEGCTKIMPLKQQKAITEEKPHQDVNAPLQPSSSLKS
ncbi:hypothetical protein FBU30_007046 [Linnemannia zychae]|nr:hypothetical protein FBU30_007046 [Linnemannia zychae]